MISFENRAEGQLNLGEDVYLSKNQSLLRGVNLTEGINEFEIELLGRYLGLPMQSFPKLVSKIPILQDPYKNSDEEHYEQTNYIIENLSHLPKSDSPKFVFAHLIVPHFPYIFSPDGSLAEESLANDEEGYLRNVKFINAQLIPLLKLILENSETSPCDCDTGRPWA